jgi:hypothetical protein
MDFLLSDVEHRIKSRPTSHGLSGHHSICSSGVSAGRWLVSGSEIPETQSPRGGLPTSALLALRSASPRRPPGPTRSPSRLRCLLRKRTVNLQEVRKSEREGGHALRRAGPRAFRPIERGRDRSGRGAADRLEPEMQKLFPRDSVGNVTDTPGERQRSFPRRRGGDERKKLRSHSAV